MITLLKSPIQKYTRILHVADIHIRLNKRHDEFREVFNNLYEEIKKTPDTTLVAILGDVLHNKVDLSPECVQLASELFTNIANLRPVILIAGNHDMLVSNKSRLDSLSPIVDALNHPNLFYLKTTGLYGFGNILFNNMGVFDSSDVYIKGANIPSIYRNQYEHVIALFHGAVDKASLETGYSISNPSIMTPLFDCHDIALLGDIHHKQDMQEYLPDENKPCVHYVGSLLQQNHGEGLRGHGYSLWDLKTRTYKHHEVTNNFGYFTVEIHNGTLLTKLTDIPKKVRLRIKTLDVCIASELKTIVASIREVSDVIEIAYVRMDQRKDKSDVIPLCKDIVLTDLTNVDYQNRLIKDFLIKKLEIIDESAINDILAINRNTNLLIKRDDFTRNLRWKPIRFEFNNMFAYGEHNVIDFTQMSGTYGIFGLNKTGKSSILSALIFCLFDKFDRGYKGMFVLNSQKTSFNCKLEFEISNVRYFIERKGTETKSGNVKVDVKFWKIVDGVEEELHGTARRDTNDVIRDYVGTYEDFIATAASFMNAKNYVSFIDMGNSERKDLLVQFIGVNVFDRLHESGGERSKEINTILKLHKNKNYQGEIQQKKNALEEANTSLYNINTEIDSLKKQIFDVNEQIIAETSNLIKLDMDVPTDLVVLSNNKQFLDSSINTKKNLIKNNNLMLAEKNKKIVEINDEILKIEQSNLAESHKNYKTFADKITEIKQKIELKKVEVKGKLEKVARLEKHEYDPNCKYCNNNSFVKDATKAKQELIKDKKDTDRMLLLLEDYRTEFAQYKWVEQAYEKYTKLLTEKSQIKDECSVINNNLIVSANALEKLETSYTSIIHQIELYHRNETSVQVNIKTQSNIAAYRASMSKLDIELQKKNKILVDISGKRELYTSEITKLSELIEEIIKLESELSLYQQYLLAVGRDGIPYQVICNTVPEIEKEINSILSQIVDFNIEFETDGKNIIPFIVYENGKWPIENGSGYERFISSIAIRIGLTNVSNLPRTNFIAIDEGFGTLDPEHMASMSTLFSILKNVYDFIIVISHLDALKDAVDKTIEVKQEGNFSKVVFE